MRPLLLAALLVLSAPAVRAQQTDDAPQRVVLTDGRTFVGTVVDNGDGTVTIVDRSGVRTVVAKAQVARIDAGLPGGFERLDPAGSRMFITPTAFTIPKGQKRISTFVVVMPSFGIGLTDRLDASVYATIPAGGDIGGFAGVNAKFNLVRSPSVSAAVGASVNTIYGVDTDSAPLGGSVYGIATFGNEARNVSAGAYALYGGTEGDIAFADGGMGVSLSGGYQVSNSLKLMSENVAGVSFTDNSDWVSAHLLGIRFFGDRITGDLALPFVNVDGNFEYSRFPYVGFSYNF